MLDQFMVDKNMAIGDAPIKVDQATVQILRPPATVNLGIYPMPIPFGGMGKPVNQNGFSDHFPITVTATRSRLGRQPVLHDQPARTSAPIMGPSADRPKIDMEPHVGA